MLSASRNHIKTTLLTLLPRLGIHRCRDCASAASIQSHDFDKLVFSFHGIPQRHLVKGDPSHSHCLSTHDCCNTCHPAHATCYRHQCAMTVEKFVAAANLPKDKYMITFKSRLGREPWLQPYTDKTLEQLAKKGKRRSVICPAFTPIASKPSKRSLCRRDGFLKSGGEDFEQSMLERVPRLHRFFCGRCKTGATEPTKAQRHTTCLRGT